MKSNKIKAFCLYTDWNRKGAEGLYGGIGWYRIINPLSKIENTTIEGKFQFGSKERADVARYIKSVGDIMYIKYVDSLVAVNHILTIRDIMGLKLVVDIDDDVFNVHPYNYAYKDIHEGTESHKAFQLLFREADALVTSTEHLREAMLPYNKNITVIPNTIDPEIWKVPIKKNKSDTVKIGWVYGPTHSQDVPVILPVIKEILKKYPNVEFTHIGFKDPDFDNLKGNHKMVFGTNGYKEFPAFLASQGMDILIAPILDDYFNRSKSNIKWMEGAMCEVPMVCSAVEPYNKSITHGKDGFLAKTTSEWIKYLSLLIENKDLIEKIGKEAKKTVLREYTVDKHLHKYTDLFKKLNKKHKSEVTAVITRRKGEEDGLALETLKRQTYPNIKFVRIEDKELKGQNWAKNQGLRKVKTKYVLFSDNDIKWKLNAVKKMVKVLEENPDCSYSFGAYLWKWEKDGQKKTSIACRERWTPERLRDFDRGNMVSTMALCKTADVPEMDETTKRLTDWDLWLTMLEQGKKGIHCGEITFETEFHQGGVSRGNPYTYEMALNDLKKKHENIKTISK